MNQLAGSKWGKRIIIPLGFLSISYLIYSLFFGGTSLEEMIEQGKDANYPVAHKVSADDLWGAYAKDMKAANSKYGDTFTEVTGTVRKADLTRTPAVLLIDTPSKEYGIECLFNEKGAIEAVQAGQQVRIQGLVGQGRSSRATSRSSSASCRSKAAQLFAEPESFAELAAGRFNVAHGDARSDWQSPKPGIRPINRATMYMISDSSSKNRKCVTINLTALSAMTLYFIVQLARPSVRTRTVSSRFIHANRIEGEWV